MRGTGRTARAVAPVLAVSSGLLLAAAFPPLDVGVAGFVALLPLSALARHLHLARATTGGGALRGLGWGTVAGLVFFGLLIPWLIPFGVIAWVLLGGIQALWMGLFVAGLVAWGDRRWRPAIAVALWVAIEAARAQWPLGGFAWGVLGYTQHDAGMALGMARTVGVYGVSALLAAVGVSVEEVIHRAAGAWQTARSTDVPADAVFTAARTPLLSVLGLLIVAVLATGEPPTDTGRTVSFGIVQGGDTRATSAAGVARIDSDRIQRVAQLQLDVTRQLADDPPDIVVWPENSVDADVRADDGAEVAAILDQAVDLVSPSPILAGEFERGARPRTLYNQLTVFTQDGIGDSYRKRRPVPFGEYVPAREALDWFPPLRQIPADVLPGPEAQVLDVAGARIGGVICFENTFPELVRTQVQAGADVLVVATNNSSFGDTAMSQQHLAFSRLRAVETGRWVVHAGISGISGFVSPEGELMQATELFTPATPVMDVPLVDDLTLATRIGPLVPGLAQLVALAAMGLVAGQALRRRRDENG